jgi:hypothetical protein
VAEEPLGISDLKAIVSSEITSAVGFHGGELSSQRQMAMEFYYGEPYGNELEGESQIVTQDVLETVEWIMPSLLQRFTAGDKLVDFEPKNEDDVPAARQKTVYVNHVVRKDNPGFMVFYSWFKDALLQKNGIIKTWWDETPTTTRQTYHNITSIRRGELEADPDVEIIEETLIERTEEEIMRDVMEAAEAAQASPELAGYIEGFLDRYDLTVVHTDNAGRVRIDPVPPEEFLIARRAITIPNAPFTGHRFKRTVSEMVEEGFDAEQLRRVASSDAGGVGEFSPERQARHEIDDEYPDQLPTRDEAMREVWITECFLRVDFDGDGIAELRRITVAGEDTYEILDRWGEPDNAEIDESPFDSITPIPIPHKFYGMSYADLTMDLQQIHSILMRQLLNNVYSVNNGRTALWEEHVDLDDWLEQTIGGYVRTTRPPGEVMMELRTEPIIQHIVPVLQLLHEERQERTGVTKYNQGLDSSSLNDTATGVTKIMNAANQRIDLIARIFAETGVRDLFLRVQRLIIANQDESRMIQLQNEWVEMDPRTWVATSDATIEVGLGFESKEQEAMLLQQVILNQQAIAEAQGGLDGPIVTWDKIYESSRALARTGGLRRVERFYEDPAMAPPKEPQPDPAQAQAQIEAEIKMKEIEMNHEAKMEEIRLTHIRGLLSLKMENAENLADQHMKQAQQSIDTTMAATQAVQRPNGGNGAAQL